MLPAIIAQQEHTVLTPASVNNAQLARFPIHLAQALAHRVLRASSRCHHNPRPVKYVLIMRIHQPEGPHAPAMGVTLKLIWSAPHALQEKCRMQERVTVLIAHLACTPINPAHLHASGARPGNISQKLERHLVRRVLAMQNPQLGAQL